MLYFTPAAIGYLCQFIVAAAITLYLIHRLRHPPRQMHAFLLAGFFAATALLVLLLFIDVALLPGERLRAVYLENTVIGLMLVLILQFAYRFPRLDPRERWGARILLVLGLLYTAAEFRFAVFRFSELTAGHVFYRLAGDDELVVGFLLVPLVFARQVVYADARQVSWIRKLVQPQGNAARAARGFALVFLIALFLGVVNLYRAMVMIPTSIYQLSLSLGLLLALYSFAAVYLNNSPEPTSFIVKVSGAILITLLTVLGAVGWVITPVYAEQYRTPLSDKQTLRFTPNPGGGYDVERAPFHFDDELGHAIAMPAIAEIHSVPLDFTFPFFGRTSRTVYVTNLGAVAVGQPLAQCDVQYDYGTTPAIFALGTFLVPGAGVFAKNENDQLTITWHRVQSYMRRQTVFTFQLVLNRTGAFAITYNGIPPDLTHAADEDPYDSLWFVGVVPGDSFHPPQQVDLSAVPVRVESTGLVQDDYLGFRRYLNRLLAPVAQLIVVSVLITAAFPLLLYTGLVQPLNSLMDGMRQVNAGNRSVSMPVRSRDEIGFLTESFNGMLAQVQALVTNLETRVADRTRELSALYAISDISTRSQDLETLLNESLTPIVAALRGSTGAIMLLADEPGVGETASLRLMAHRGGASGPAPPVEVQAGKAGWLAMLQQQRRPLLIPDVEADPRTPAAMRALGRKTLLLAPVCLERQFWGVIGLSRDASQPFAEQEIVLLTRVSEQLAISLESHRLRQLAHQSALTEERHRLARDMHDSVTQALYSMTLFAKASQSSIRVGNLPLTSQYVDRMNESALQALKDMRLLIFELRPSVLNQVGLAGALRQRLEAVERRAGVAVECHIAEMPDLSGERENDIFQSAQEALNNILKHAGATWVALRLTREAGELVLTIEDDGKGFDPASIGKTGGVGLTSMCERAERIGGHLTIDTRPGGGTRVSLTVSVSGGAAEGAAHGSSR